MSGNSILSSWFKSGFGGLQHSPGFPDSEEEDDAAPRDDAPEIVGIDEAGAGAAAAGDEAPEQAEPVDAEVLSRRQAKKALDLLRGSYENTAAFASSLFQDSRLQIQARILVDVLQFLHHEYAEDARIHSQGQKAQMEWQGERSLGSFWRSCVKALDFLQGPALNQRLDLAPKPFHSSAAPTSASDESVQQDMALVNQAFNFTVDLVANRCWSQAFRMWVFPYCFAAIAGSDKDRARQRLRSLAQGLLSLEEKAGRGGTMCFPWNCVCAQGYFKGFAFPALMLQGESPWRPQACDEGALCRRGHKCLATGQGNPDRRPCLRLGTRCFGGLGKGMLRGVRVNAGMHGVPVLAFAGFPPSFQSQ